MRNLLARSTVKLFWTYTGQLLFMSSKKKDVELYLVFYVEAQRKKGILDKILR